MILESYFVYVSHCAFIQHITEACENSLKNKSFLMWQVINSIIAIYFEWYINSYIKNNLVQTYLEQNNGFKIYMICLKNIYNTLKTKKQLFWAK